MSQLEHIDAIERRLWSAADTLRANSKYASNEYFLPVMGLVLLRHGYSRYLAVKDEIGARLPTRRGKEADGHQEGLRPEVDRAEIEADDWSLPPGRYVGVAPEEEDEDFDLATTMREIHAELADLNTEAAVLAARIRENSEKLGI